MNKCMECSFLIRLTEHSNFICSIEKLRNPHSPGLYVKNPNEKACNYNFRKKIKE